MNLDTSYVPVSIMSHYSLPGDVSKKVGIWIMQNTNASSVGHASQWNPNILPTLNMGIYEVICLLMFTVHAYGEQSKTLLIGQV